MKDKSDLSLLQFRVQQIQEAVDWLQMQLDSVNLEVNRTVSALVEERDSLRWRVDPFSNDATSLADSDDI